MKLDKSRLHRESEPDLGTIMRESGLSVDAEIYRGRLWKQEEKQIGATPFYTGGVLPPTVESQAHNRFCTVRRRSSVIRPDLRSVVTYRTRNLLFARDRGCCQLCGFNCLDFMVAINFVRNRLERNALSFDVRFEDFLECLGPRARKYPKALLEIDHILPRSQGGEDTLENLRTLCLVCHRKETNRLIYARSGEREAAV